MAIKNSATIIIRNDFFAHYRCNLKGYIKLIRNKETDKLIGARILASEGSELLMEISLALQYGITVKELKQMFHPYLTQSKGIKIAAISFDKDVNKLSCCAV